MKTIFRVPPLIALLTGVTMWLLKRHFPILNFFSWPWTLVGVLPPLFGMAMAMTAGRAFKKAETTINPVDPTQASHLVTTGIFAKTRNPMYTGLLLLLSGWTIELGALSPLAGPVFFFWYISKFQIAREEKALTEKFGAPYLEYMSRVPRWF